MSLSGLRIPGSNPAAPDLSNRALHEPTLLRQQHAPRHRCRSTHGPKKQSQLRRWTASPDWFEASSCHAIVGLSVSLCGVWKQRRRRWWDHSSVGNDRGLSGKIVACGATTSQKGKLPSKPEQGNVDIADALGQPLAGKALLIGWDPGPKAREGLDPDEPHWTPEESLEELEVLLGGLDIEVKERVLQKWNKDIGNMPIGKGKVAELREKLFQDPEIGVVVCDKDMQPSQLYRLKTRLSPDGRCQVIDRTALILRIFAARARTKEARLQIKLATQKFMLPRLRYYLTEGGGLEARGGSSGGLSLRGAGETQLMKDKQKLEQQITNINRQIEAVKKHRATKRGSSDRLNLPVVALAGYTNAGKSTLLNRLFGNDETESRDRLFETLDPTRRRVTLENGRDVLLIDTVGFIQRLPQLLVLGFRATLEEIVEASVILHVVDVSSPTAAQQVSTVVKTLREIPGYNEKTPQILVFNKVDKLPDGIPPELEQSLLFPWPGVVGHCHISALKGIGLAGLAEAIETSLVEHTDFGRHQMQILIPYSDTSIYSRLRGGKKPLGQIVEEEHTEEGYLLRVIADPASASRLQPYVVEDATDAPLSTAAEA